MYRSISRGQIADTILHLRELYRSVAPSGAQEQRAHERREVVSKNLLSNLIRTKQHPTLQSVIEVADIFSLTLDGAHRLFGYELDSIRDYDIRLNESRTHIVESYLFERDLPVDLPSHLGFGSASSLIVTLDQLVPGWHRNIPFRALEAQGWQQPGTFYVHVGTEDSLGSSVPPGALALVEPIREEEIQRPNPRSIYLLQFGNGYRCSHCVVTRGKLLLLVSGRDYIGPQEFAYPGTVRVAGRIRMFASELPLGNFPLRRSLPPSKFDVPLILPWEHKTLDELFAASYLRFQRGRADVKGGVKAGQCGGVKVGQFWHEEVLEVAGSVASGA